jgi:hypothetical protein
MHILTKLVFSLPFFLIVVLPISNNGFFNQWKVWDEKSINLFILVPSCWGKIFMKIKVPNNRICMLHHRSIVRRSCQSVMNYESLHWTNFTEKIHSFWDCQEHADGVRISLLLGTDNHEKSQCIMLVPKARKQIYSSLYTVYTTAIVDFVCSFSSPKPQMFLVFEVMLIFLLTTRCWYSLNSNDWKCNLFVRKNNLFGIVLIRTKLFLCLKIKPTGDWKKNQSKELLFNQISIIFDLKKLIRGLLLRHSFKSWKIEMILSRLYPLTYFQSNCTLKEYLST